MIRDTIDRLRRLVNPEPAACRFALVLSGGGARACYQAGVLQYIAEEFPESRFDVLSGVSAGAINTCHLANHRGTFVEATDALVRTWLDIRSDQVFVPESGLSLLRSLFRFGIGGRGNGEARDGRHGLVDISPLRAFLGQHLANEEGRLTGVTENILEGRLLAAAVATTNYMTGQTVTWVQGENIEDWERPNRVGVNTTLTIDHIMASTSLPLLFPAVQIGDAWYGDGGIRLSAPLSPAIHLGADRLLIVSTRYERSRTEADEPVVVGYPPAAQIIGVLMNAIFLDNIDQDAMMMQRINALLAELPRRKRYGLRPIRLLMLRPSVDLARLASKYDTHLQGALGLLTTGLGTGESASPDWLSMLLFETEYVTTLLEIGYRDARGQRDQIAAFLDPESEPVPQYAKEEVLPDA